MSMFSKSQRVFVPSFKPGEVQGIVLCGHDHLLEGQSYTVWWTDNKTLLPCEAVFTEADLAKAQGSNGASVASKETVIAKLKIQVDASDLDTALAKVSDLKRDLKKAKKISKKRSRKKSKSRSRR